MSSKRLKRRKSCEGKVKHETAAYAFIAMKKTGRQGLQVYKCHFCGKYHVGHLDKVSKRARQNRGIV